MSGGIELICCRQPGGAGADDGDLLAGAQGWGCGLHETLVEGYFDDMLLDFLDGDGRLVDAQHAAALTGSGTDAAGELGEIIGGAQDLVRLLPLLPING